MQQNQVDIEELNKKFDDIVHREFKSPSPEDVAKYYNLVKDVLESKSKLTETEFKLLKSKYSFVEKNSFLFQIYINLVDQGVLPSDDYAEQKLRDQLRIKVCKSHSGVLVITVFTSPYPEYIDKETGSVVTQSFSCAWNCAYCPNEPGQPRSYLKGEPGVLRANRNNFDCVDQMVDRMKGLYMIGHPIDKLEVIVLGGTWVSYPEPYREAFCRDIYYAANTFWDVGHKRIAKSLEDEKEINVTARTKVIGLTLETRPDTINAKELKLLRYYGCTRVQLGIQHIHDDVLQKIERKCTSMQIINAIQRLKDSGFKVDSHWMPNLPGSNPQKDHDLLIDTLLGMKHPIPKRYTEFHKTFNLNIHFEEYELTNEEYQTDQWKVYPCAIVPWTKIEEWYNKKEFIPYPEEELMIILVKMKSLIFPWIRLNRIIRDIPFDYIIASSDKSNMRQELACIMSKDGTRCNCIRCREVKTLEWDGTYDLVVRKYNASQGTEYFISAESKNRHVLYGFCRLRICNPLVDVFPELDGCGLIRELHVYGNLSKTNAETHANHVQHKGIGKLLMTVAHDLSINNGYIKTAVIAGEGTKEYYIKLGYRDNGNFMIK